MLTPWGNSNYEKIMAPGVTLYSTPSHGGFLVDDNAARYIPAAIRDRAFAGHPWYEEDCDWAVVVWYVPGFEGKLRKQAFDALMASTTYRDLVLKHENLS